MKSKSLKIILLCLINLPFLSFTQQKNCNCSESFDEIYNYLKTNYAGWDIKINKKNSKNFNLFTNEIRKKAYNSKAEIDCYLAASAWIDFFKDGHIQISSKIPLLDNELEIVNISENKINNLLKPADNQSIEGIWEDEQKSYKFAIVKSPNQRRDYAAVVLESTNPKFKKGSVKFEILKNTQNVVYIKGDLSLGSFSFKRNGNNSINFEGNWLILNRITKNSVETNKKETSQKPNFTYSTKELDIETLLITLPTFEYGSSNAPIDSFYAANEKAIASHKYLIIDVRNNPGGNSDGFEPLRKFYYTNPLKEEGYVAYLTKENSPFWVKVYDFIEKVNKDADFFKNPNYQKQYKLAQYDLQLIKDNFGSGKAIQLTENVTVMDTILPFPQKVGVIINKGCASTAEWFALEVKQSKKVTLFGEPTHGVIDYVKVRERELNCDKFGLAISIGRRTNRLPEEAIDNIGIKPDIFLPNSIIDWVEIVRKKLKMNK